LKGKPSVFPFKTLSYKEGLIKRNTEEKSKYTTAKARKCLISKIILGIILTLNPGASEILMNEGTKCPRFGMQS